MAKSYENVESLLGTGELPQLIPEVEEAVPSMDVVKKDSSYTAKDYIFAPYELGVTALGDITGMIGGPIYGLARQYIKDPASYGTQEGARGADRFAGEAMEKLAYEPKSRLASDIYTGVGEFLEEQKLDAPLPMLFTQPAPGIGSLRYAKKPTEDIKDRVSEEIAYRTGKYEQRPDYGKFYSSSPFEKVDTFRDPTGEPTKDNRIIFNLKLDQTAKKIEYDDIKKNLEKEIKDLETILKFSSGQGLSNESVQTKLLNTRRQLINLPKHDPKKVDILEQSFNKFATTMGNFKTGGKNRDPFYFSLLNDTDKKPGVKAREDILDLAEEVIETDKLGVSPDDDFVNIKSFSRPNIGTTQFSGFFEDFLDFTTQISPDDRYVGNTNINYARVFGMKYPNFLDDQERQDFKNEFRDYNNKAPVKISEEVFGDFVSGRMSAEDFRDKRIQAIQKRAKEDFEVIRSQKDVDRGKTDGLFLVPTQDIESDILGAGFGQSGFDVYVDGKNIGQFLFDSGLFTNPGNLNYGGYSQPPFTPSLRQINLSRENVLDPKNKITELRGKDPNLVNDPGSLVPLITRGDRGTILEERFAPQYGGGKTFNAAERFSYFLVDKLGEEKAREINVIKTRNKFEDDLERLMSKSYLQNLSVAQNARLSTFLPYSDLPPTVPFFQKDIVIPKDFTPTFTNTQRLIQKYADVTFPNDVNQKRDFISRTNQMIPMMAAQMKFLLDLPEALIVGKIPRQEPYYDFDSPVTYEERKKGISNYTGPLKLTSFGKQIDKKLKSFDFANRVSLRSLPEYLQNKIIVDAIAYSLGKQIQRTGVYNFDNVGIESFLSPLSGFSKVSDLEKAEKATKARGFVIDPPFPAQRQTAYAEKNAKKEPLPNVPPLPSRDVNTGKQELSGNFPYYLPRNVQQQALAAEEISQNLTRKMTPLEILRAAPSILKRIAESGNYGKMKQQFSAYDTGEVREGGLKRFIFRDKDGNEEAIDEDVNLDSMFKKKLNPVVASLLKTIFKRPVYEGGALRVDAKGKPLMEGYVPGYINYILRHPTGIAPKTTYKRAAEILRSIKPVLLGPVFETPNQPPLRKTTGIRSMLRSYDNKEDFGQVNPLQRRIYGGLQIIDPTLKKYEGQGFFPRFNEEAGFLEPGDSGGIVSESRSVKEFPMLSYETQEANFRRKDKRLDEDENELLFQEGDVVIRSPYNMEEFFDPKKSEVIPQYVANPVRKDQIFTDVLMRSEKVPTEDFLDKNNNPLPFSQILKMAKGQRNVSARSVLSRIEAKKYPDINLNNLTDSVEYRVNSLKNSFTPEELLVDTSLFLKIGSNANVKGWYQNTSPKGFEIRGKIMDQCIGGYGYAKDCLIGSNFREKMSFQSPVKKVFNYFDEDGIPRVTYSLSRNNEGVFTEEPEPGGMKGIGDTDETVIPYEKEVTLLREKLSEILIPSQGQFETSEGSDIFSRQKKENE